MDQEIEQVTEIHNMITAYLVTYSFQILGAIVVMALCVVLGVWGVVKEVTLASTSLTNEDEEKITITNRHIIGEVIHNSQSETVLELLVGIAYESDTAAAIEIIAAALSDVEGLSQSRAVQVGIYSFGDSAINTGIRCWVRTEKFYEVKFTCNQKLQDALTANNIAIPFPQREVRTLADAV